MIRHAFAVMIAACVGCASTSGARSGDTSRASTGALAGIVTDGESYAAVSLASVTVDVPGTEQQVTELTDARGRFAIDGLAPGRYRVVARYGDATAVELDVPVTAGGSTDVKLALDAIAPVVLDPAATGAGRGAHATVLEAGAVAGQVTESASGDRLEGAVVTLSASHLDGWRFALTDADGRYRVPNLPAGTYSLSAYYRLVDFGDIELKRLNIVVEPTATTTVDLVFDTSAGSRAP